MGAFKMFSGCSHNEPTPRTEYIVKEVRVREKAKTFPNPNPTNFKILKVVDIGNYIVVEVNYPDCTNYEGNKIMVYENITEKELRKLKFLDPHFCDGNHASPVARFEPTKFGWDCALSLISNLNQNILEKFNDEICFDIKAEYFKRGGMYHNILHPNFMLDLLNEVSEKINDKLAIEIAVWFHDFVLDPQRKDNELQSANMAKLMLEKQGWKSLAQKVYDLVLATKHENEPTNEDAKYLVDMDLAIFGKSENEFDKYETGIEKEYAFAPKDKFVYYRKLVIEKFLSRTHIYRTKYFQDKYEMQARKNLNRSLEKLNKQTN